MGKRRFDVALFLLFALLTGCGGGGGGTSPSAAQLLPPPVQSTPAPASGPVSYFQDSGASGSGTILAGARQAMVAVVSGATAPKSFANDTLTLTSSAMQTAARRATARPVRAPARITPVEAFPADDRSLLAEMRTLEVSGGGAPVRRAQSVFTSATIGTTAQVWVQQGALGGSRLNIQVPATFVAQTAHMNIWVDSSLQFSQSQIAQIGVDAENAYASDTAHFASPDYPSNAPALGPQYNACSSGGAKNGTAPEYIAEPADHRIDVMVVNGQNLGGLGGYFSAANLMTQSTLNCLNGSSSQYESNQAPFIFVGWFPNSGTSYDLQEDLVRSTAHELQHLINFVNHAILPQAASSSSFNGNEEPYINEGLSMLAQDLAVQQMYGSQSVKFDVDDALSRAAVYLASPANYSLSAFTGADPVSWGGSGGAQYNCGGGCYGVAYLFQRYLRDRFGGDAYTHGMETSGFIGSNNLQATTGESASSLFGDFALAMAANTLAVNSADPRFAFGSLNLTGTYADQFGASATLSGVFAQPYSGGSTGLSAPVGGFTFVGFGSVPQAGATVSVSDDATAAGFSLEGGLVQK